MTSPLLRDAGNPLIFDNGKFTRQKFFVEVSHEKAEFIIVN